MKIQNLTQKAGKVFIAIGIVLLLVHSFILTKSVDETFFRDLLGFRVPQPPEWISYFPYLGLFIGFIFEFSSLHGLAGLVIAIVFFGIGDVLLKKDTDPIGKFKT